MKDNIFKVEILDYASKLDAVTNSYGEIMKAASAIVEEKDNPATLYLINLTSKLIKSTDSSRELKRLANALKDSIMKFYGYCYILDSQDKSFGADEDTRSLKELLDDLNKLVGLESIKTKVNDLIAFQTVQMLREKQGLHHQKGTLHLAFTGNPGTGKTTVARIVGRIYKQIGLLSKGHFVEVSRTDLIAGYQGQTALKVKKVIDEANGGVLFIDEAYSITENDHSDSYFGVDLSASDKTMQELYQSVDLSGKLIVLEDIERTQIDLLELMGYVNSLVEQDGVKVLLVANEKEILQYEPEEEASQEEQDPIDIFNKRRKKKELVYTAATKAYLKTKEKTVCDTIVFYGDLQEAIQQIILSFGDKRLNQFADGNHVMEIYDVMNKLHNYNLRSFIFACQKTVDIYQRLEGDYNEDFLTCIFFGIINYSLRVKTGERMNWSGTENFSLELGSEKYPLFRFCFDYINFQTLNRTKIPVADKALQNLRLYDKRKTQNDREINIVTNYHRYSERDLRAAVDSIQKRLADPTDISFYDYGVLAVYLLRVKHCYGFDVTEGQRLLVENLRGRGAEIEAEALFRITMRNAEEALRKEFDALRKAMSDALKGEEHIPGFSYLPEQAQLFRTQFQLNRECQETGKLVANFDIPRLLNMFFACTPAQMDEIRYAFLRTYESSNIGDFLSGDKDALTQLRDGIIAGIKKHDLDCVQKVVSRVMRKIDFGFWQKSIT